MLQGCYPWQQGVLPGDHGGPNVFCRAYNNTLEQAFERSADNEENKGAEAAISAVEMVNLVRTLRD